MSRHLALQTCSQHRFRNTIVWEMLKDFSITTRGTFKVCRLEALGRGPRHLAQSSVIGTHSEYETVPYGLLMSYGQDQQENFRKAAVYIDKILRGAKPADLPVQQPTRFKLIINLKAAKALSLSIPTSLLMAADDVIE
jgi:hypothetical protein